MSIMAACAVPHPPLIIPAVGRGKEQGIPETVASYDEVARRLAALEPELVIVSSPHSVMYRDWFHISPGSSAHGDMHQFQAYQTGLDVVYDEEFTTQLNELCAQEGFPAGTDGERDASIDHATYIPLWFLNKYYTDYKAVRLGLSGLDPLDHYRFGQLVAQCVESCGRRTVYIASGDLSHKLKEDGPYGFTKEGPVFDEQVTASLGAGDFETLLSFDEFFCERAAECGLRSFQIMAGALDGLAVDAELLSYEGPFGVGYGVAYFDVIGSDPSRCFADALHQQAADEIACTRADEDEYVRLARSTIEHFVRSHGTTPQLPDGLTGELLERRAGAFVSIHKQGRLRGCIGTIAPYRASLAEEILHNAISACSEDPRFDPVREDELDELEINVDVLGEAEPVSSEDELDPKRYGVIVSTGMRRGLLLPDLEGVDTVEEQVAIARRKAGIGPNEPVELQRFEVVRHT